MTIRAFPLAQNLYKKYCQLYGPSALWDIFTQEDDFLSQAEFTLREKNEPISVAANAFRKVHKDIEADLCEEIRKLKNHHIQLNEKFPQDFTDLSVQDTIMKLLILGDIKMAEKLKNEFKVPERRYCNAKIMKVLTYCMFLTFQLDFGGFGYRYSHKTTNGKN